MHGRFSCSSTSIDVMPHHGLKMAISAGNLLEERN